MSAWIDYQIESEPTHKAFNVIYIGAFSDSDTKAVELNSHSKRQRVGQVVKTLDAKSSDMTNS
jgi:hypothetical protein